MKKIASLLLCSALLVTALSGCSSSKSNPSTTSNNVTIKWGVFETDNYTDAFWQHIISNFEKDNPHIKVEKILMTGDSRAQWLKTQLAGGNLPDVNVDPVELAKQDGVYAEVPENILSKYEDAAIVTFNGKKTLIPAYKTLRIQAYYNKKQFAAAGIKVPTTWAEFNNDLAALKAKGFSPLMTAGPSDIWATGQPYWIAVANPELEAKYPTFNSDVLSGKVKWDNPTLESVLKDWQQWYSKGYFNKGSLSYSYTQASDEFVKGNASIMLDGSWIAPTLDKAKNTDIGCFAMPTPNGVKNYCTMPQYWGVSEASKNKDAAFKFCEYVLGGNTETYRYYIKGDGDMSVTKTPVTYPMGPLQTQFVNNFKDYKLVPEITKVVGDESIPTGFEDYTCKSFQSILTGTDIPKALQSWDTEMESLKSSS